MNILLVNQFYPPDAAPTGRLLGDVASALAARGHAVTVLCSARRYAGDGTAAGQPGDGVRVLRLGRPGRAGRGWGGALTGYLAFHAAAFARARRLRPRPDVVLSLTTPPWIGLTLCAALRGVPHVQWLMDLYPQVLAAHGVLGPRRFPYRVLAALTRRQWRQSAALITLGAGMSARVRSLLGATASPPVVEIPVWMPASARPWPDGQPNPFRQRRGWRDDETVFLYAGNMGRGHAVAPFLAAAEELSGTPGVRWAFSGGGPRQREVEAFAAAHPAARIECLPYVSEEDVNAHLCSGDVHLVALREEWAGLIVPSKLQAAFAVGRPVLFVGPPESEPAAWIRSSGGGWVVAPGDGAGLVKAVREGCIRAETGRRGDAALCFARQHFDRSMNMARLVHILEEAGKSSRSQIERGRGQ